MVERTISPAFGTFQWEEERPLFVTKDGGITSDDTGTPLVRRKTGAQAIGRFNVSALRGSTVLLPQSVADEWDARGAFVEGAGNDRAGRTAPSTLPPASHSVDDLTDDELIAWLGTVSAKDAMDTVKFGAPARAARLADAEELRDGSRSTLVKALRKAAKD